MIKGNRPELPVVLVTGASTGIGLALIKSLVTKPYRVVATSRGTSLSRFADAGIREGQRLLIRSLNINDPTARVQLVREIEQEWGGIDILVNNAGISYRSVVEHMTEADDLMQLQVNFLSPMALVRLVLPGMRAKKWGRIINVSSVGGMMVMPTMGSYSASKFALEGATEALWYELKPWNIKVTLVQPGFVHSNSFENVYWSAAARNSANAGDEYKAYYTEMTSFIAKRMKKAWATPESIAEQIIKVFGEGRSPLRLPATVDAVLFYYLRRFLPRRFYHWVLYRNLPGISKWGSNDKKN